MKSKAQCPIFCAFYGRIFISTPIIQVKKIILAVDKLLLS